MFEYSPDRIIISIEGRQIVEPITIHNFGDYLKNQDLLNPKNIR